jgi:hypothetical protein
MKNKFLAIAMLFGLLLQTSIIKANELYDHLQKVSVTIKASYSEGSGVIITREVKTGPNTTETINFVWTAGHVVDGLRSVRTIIVNGQQKRVVEFRDAQVVKELTENGRRVGELKMDAKVIKYSDADNGEDLALLMVRKRNFIDESAQFFLDGDKIIPIGTELYHVGSLLGQQGANSMTRGIMSKVGRVLNLGSGDGVVFDQTTVTAFPGSSGGGVFLSERSGDDSGKYVGMLVRGAGEGFNFIVPVRRMYSWAEKSDILWALDTNEDVPSLSDILSLPVEGEASKKDEKGEEKSTEGDINEFPFLIRISPK